MRAINSTNFEQSNVEFIEFWLLDTFSDLEIIYKLPKNEWDAIALNYTSGTTGNPKGVVYHHRGAYLNAIGNTLVWEMPMFPKYLWTLPMFHCNGWCFPWTITERAGTHVCLRQPAGELIVNALIKHKVSHLSGAPIIMQMIADHLISNKIDLTQEIKMMTAGAPPPEAVLGKMKSCGIDVIHVYGLTETYGPSVVCAWKTEWNNLSPDEQAKMKARQGVPYSVQEDIKIVDPKTLKNVPQDGETIGEVFTRGNITMRGYLKNEKATKESFEDGWFHTGDIGKIDDDGFLKITDRKKSLIVTSGGKNIAPAPLENALITSVYIEQVVAIGDKRNFISALITPNFEALEGYLKSKGHDGLSPSEMVSHPDTLELYNSEVEERMVDFAQYEKIKKFTICDRLFELEKNELTPSLKIRRKAVNENFKDIIDLMYDSE